MLKQMNVYEELCDVASNATDITNANGIVNCNERDVIFSTAGTVGGFSMNCMALVFGIIMDKKGLLISRTLMTISITAGLLCLLFTPQVNWLLFPGIFLNSAGGYGLLLTNGTMADLFPNFASVILVLAQSVFMISSSFLRNGLKQILYLYFDEQKIDQK